MKHAIFFLTEDKNTTEIKEAMIASEKKSKQSNQATSPDLYGFTAHKQENKNTNSKE